MHLKRHLESIYKSVILSDAFYLYRYDIGMTLWSALESKQTMMNCHKLLESYFTNVHKVKDPAGNASVYMRSIKILKEFIEKTYGGVTAFLENEADEIQINKGIEEEKTSERMSGNAKSVNTNVPRPT